MTYVTAIMLSHTTSHLLLRQLKKMYRKILFEQIDSNDDEVNDGEVDNAQVVKRIMMLKKRRLIKSRNKCRAIREFVLSLKEGDYF